MTLTILAWVGFMIIIGYFAAKSGKAEGERLGKMRADAWDKEVQSFIDKYKLQKPCLIKN